MPRYKIILEYDGSDFAGWQFQPDARTVQGELEKALTEFGEGAISVTGAGRTDSGVHALGQTAHFDLNRPISPEELRAALNAKTSDDIYLKHLEQAADDFHARFNAQWRRYLYVIAKEFSPIGRRFSWFLPYEYDFKTLQQITPDLLGGNDFAGFCRAKSQKENTVCTVAHAAWTQNPGQCVFEIVADRFLHEMVRLLVGTMIDIARGRFEPDQLVKILHTGDVTLCGSAAPPQGLFLAEVGYE